MWIKKSTKFGLSLIATMILGKERKIKLIEITRKATINGWNKKQAKVFRITKLLGEI